jgi:type I restriction enzyme M protein
MNLDELLSTLESPIVIRPTRRMTQGELESYLDKAADILRGNADHSEFRGYVFALLFYKRISDCFDEEVRTQATTLTKAGMSQDQALALARDPQNHHFVVPETAAWNAVARTSKAQPTSIPTSASASRMCLGSRRRKRCCVASSFTTRRNTPVG